ncbi:MAG: rhomboid family intramembrane serine protease [Erysipelotrichaceae bacterium]
MISANLFVEKNNKLKLDNKKQVNLYGVGNTDIAHTTVVDNLKEEKLKDIHSSTMSASKAKAKKMVIKRKKLKMPWVTFVIIAVCFAIFVAIRYVTDLDPDFDVFAVSIAFGAYYRNIIVVFNQFYRFITSAFIHTNPLHLLINMVAMLNLGLLLEDVLGKFRYFLVLIFSIVGGSLLVWATNSANLAFGMSGGFFGLLGCLVILHCRTGYITKPIVIIEYSLLFVINIAMSMHPSVSWEGHLGGFVVGALCGMVIFYQHELKIWVSSALVILLIFFGLGAFGSANEKVGTLYPGTDYQLVKIYRALKLDFWADKLELFLDDVYNRYHDETN